MIDCKKIAQEIKDQCKEELKSLSPEFYLKIIQVEGDAASNVYTKGKKKDCEEIGLLYGHVLLPNDCTVSDVRLEIIHGNTDNNCIGIILQLPLPKHLKQYEEYLTNCISPKKDVDGFIEESHFDPCTPAGIIHIAKEQLGSLEGKVVTVVGRGKLVGAPLVKLLNKENATIIQCNSRTPRKALVRACAMSDVIVTATGCINTISDDELYVIRDECVIIDAGINRDENGKMCGDVSPFAYNIHDKITPVPGGVGLITRAMLMKNCIDAAKRKKVYLFE
jgi:methylenetetrahydrofolate dehydrogenase (NADP+)/methenyltetrahydrofolate cyclohydrolase